MPKTKTILLWFFFFLALYQTSKGQFYDKTWIVGTLPMVTLTFNTALPDIGTLRGNNAVIAIDVACSDVSDTNGNLLFYYNGSEVSDSTTNIMEGGDTLTDSLMYLDYQAGFIEPQTNIIIPRSGKTFYLFYFSESDSLYASNTINEPDRLYYAIIDMSQNNGLGKVVSKKNIAYKGLFGDCRLTACRHANGRDWWMVHQGFENNEYFIYLVTPDSVYPPNIQQIGPSDFWADNPGAQSAFSPDGSKFVTSTSYGPLLIMDFDRCSGIFSNPDSMQVLNSSFLYNGQSEGTAHGAPGCCFSANNRFVYITNSYAMWQYDTWATDVANTAIQVGQWDTIGPAGGFYGFYQLYLLPNGKIIVDNFQGGSRAFHMIDSPDIQGVGCHFIFNGLPTSTLNASALPNMINYRLGALSGSPCDTITGIKLLSEPDKIAVYPNPSQDKLYITLPRSADGMITLTDMTGKVMSTTYTYGAASEVLHIGALPSGVYVLSYLDGAVCVAKKVVKE